MRDILTWNFDDYTNDYTKITGRDKSLKNRIRKTGNYQILNSLRT